MMHAKITEIFRSFQGEGIYLGCPQVFIRFFGCSLNCSFCDTPQSKEGKEATFREYTPRELIQHVLDMSQPCHSISLTGGEPLEHVGFLKQICPELKKHKKIYLETNGVYFQQLKDIVDEVDIISMDIKLPSSMGGKSYYEKHQEFLKIALRKEVFIKIVVTRQAQKGEIIETSQRVSAISKDVPVVIQPNTFDLESELVTKSLTFCDDCLKYLTNVRLIPQIHKWLKVQ